MLRPHAAALIQQNANGYRNIARRELGNLLRLAVFKNAEVGLLKTTDKPASGVLHANVQQDAVHIAVNGELLLLSGSGRGRVLLSGSRWRVLDGTER
ncbi:MAG: hypothetical protein ABSB67_02565 [Bryobacteraceae bacterium]